MSAAAPDTRHSERMGIHRTGQDRILVLLRHGKSDWSVPARDDERPLTSRGTRQARQAGRWVADHVDPQLALVSVARRAQQTWDAASAELPRPPTRRDSDRLYTFDAQEVLNLVRSLAEELGCALLVGHDPAFEEAVRLLTDRGVEMKTSALAVVRLDSWSSAGDGRGDLLAHGRPPPT